MGDSERYRGRREIFAGNEILQPCSLRDRHGVDGTKSPVDRVPGGRRIGMFRGRAATTWPCGSAFPIWWPVDTITTSGDRRSPLEAAGDGRGGTPAPGPAAVQLVHRRFADVR